MSGLLARKAKVQWNSVLNTDNILDYGVKRSRKPTAKQNESSAKQHATPKASQPRKQAVNKRASKPPAGRKTQNLKRGKSQATPATPPKKKKPKTKHAVEDPAHLESVDTSTQTLIPVKPVTPPTGPALNPSSVSAPFLAGLDPRLNRQYDLRPRASIKYAFSPPDSGDEKDESFDPILKSGRRTSLKTPSRKSSASTTILTPTPVNKKPRTSASKRSKSKELPLTPVSIPSPPPSPDFSGVSKTEETDASTRLDSKKDITDVADRLSQPDTSIIPNSLPLLALHVTQAATGEWTIQPIQEHGQISKKRVGGKTLDQRPTKRPARTRAVPPLSQSPAITESLPTTHIRQSADGSWITETTQTKVRSSKKRKRDNDSLDADYTPPDVPSPVQDVHSSTSSPAKSTAGKVTKRTEFNKNLQSVQADKPLPYGEPPVWAEKRQSLCEALPYYRAYMSGAHMHEGVVRAFMVDKEVGNRDKFDEEILIARVGGGRTLNEETGIMVQTSDQERSKFASGFMRAKELNQAVAIIAGQGNRLSPSKLPHYYNVLDWFHVTDVWCELSGTFKCWMVRLEKVRLDVKSWWAAATSAPLDPFRDLNQSRCLSKRCNICNKESKEIFNLGWTCLETACRNFFNFGGLIDDSALDYNQNFMLERSSYTGKPLDPLAPALMSQDDLESMNGTGTEAACYRGIVCPLCKGCSRRREWHQWTCETPGCSFKHSIVQIPIKVWQAMAQGTSELREFCNYDFGIRSSLKILGRYDVHEYVVPGVGENEIAGIIRLFKSSPTINSQPDGPNDLFNQMQERDFGLKRNAARQGGSTGEVLTSHFATNWGAPYKYGVSVISRGFDEAPPVIIKAVKRLTWAGQQTVTKDLDAFHPFNELLSIGYFEDTDIGYHDDGESTLGPTVASLSLGAQAVMSFRPKAKSGLGPKSKNAKGTKRDVLRITLDHGDLMVMHGTQIQKLYEHAVKPSGKLRFALTCRYVKPELMANDEERRAAEVKGALPAGHERYDYTGDVHAIAQETRQEDVMHVAKCIIKSGELSKAELQELAALIVDVRG